MNPDLYRILPWIAALAFAAIGLMNASDRKPLTGSWLGPAALSALFGAWSFFAIAREGIAAVWTEHTRNAWGNQIWFDLLMAAGLAMALLFPRTRAVGMHPARWLVLVALSGSVGLFAMLARCLYLEARRAPAAR